MIAQDLEGMEHPSHRGPRRAFTRRRPPPATTLMVGLTAMISVGWPIGLVSLGYPTDVLELVFLAASIAAISRGYARPRHIVTAICIAAYIAVSAVLAVGLRSVNILDFIQAFKCWWYLLLLLGFASRRYFDATDIRRITTITLYVYFGVYFVKRILLGIDRPTVLIENNFELIFVSLLFYLLFLVERRIRPLNLLLFGGIIALSGSRSSSGVAVVVLLFCSDFRRLRLRDVLVFGGVLAAFAVAFLIFVSRSHGGDLESIDRYRFFQHFLYATHDWSIGDYALGARRLTPLPSLTCASLSYYDSLFSYSGNGTCYSVILHAFNLRAILDHGILGYMMMMYCVWVILANHTKKVRFCILTVIFLTGLSVSALNNVYVAISLAFFSALKSADGPKLPGHASSSRTSNLCLSGDVRQYAKGKRDAHQ